MSSGQGEGFMSNLGPLGILIVSIVIGGFSLYNFSFEGTQLWVYAVLLVFSILGVTYVGWNFHSIRQESGTGDALNWMFEELTENSYETKAESVNDKPEKTPAAPESLKNELYFERANRQCEWCDDRIDTPEVHHIKPRADGGPNTPTNLIVLCPNCHRKADGGTLSRSRLKYRVQEQLEKMEGDIP